MARKGGAPENLDPVRTKEEAKKRGKNGGVKSGEARRNKRDAKNAMNLLLDMAAKGSIKQNLVELGYDDSDQTNMNALMARLYTMAMSGNLQAFDRIITISGNNPEENRKERESLAADSRKERELQARLERLEQGESSSGALSDNLDPFADEEKEDVVILMPYNGRDGKLEVSTDKPEVKVEEIVPEAESEPESGESDG